MTFLLTLYVSYEGKVIRKKRYGRKVERKEKNECLEGEKSGIKRKIDGKKKIEVSPSKNFSPKIRDKRVEKN